MLEEKLAKDLLVKPAGPRSVAHKMIYVFMHAHVFEGVVNDNARIVSNKPNGASINCTLCL